MSNEVSIRRKAQALKQVAEYRPGLVIVVLIVTVIAALLEGLGLSFLLPIIEQVQSDQSLSGQGGLIGVFVTVYQFLGVPIGLGSLVGGAILVISMRFFMTFLSAYLRADLQMRYVKYLQDRAFKNALTAKVGYFDKQGSDTILNTIVTEARQAGQVIGLSVMVMNDLLLCLMYLSITVLLAPRLTLFTIIVLGGALYIIRAILESGYAVGNRVAEANESVQQAAQAGTQGIRDVKLFGLISEIHANFHSALNTSIESSIKLKRNKAAIDNAYRLVAALTVIALIFVAFTYTSLSVGGLGLFLMAMFRLSPRLSSLNDKIYEVAGYLPHLIRTEEFINRLERNQEPADDLQSVPDRIEEVAYDNVEFAYEGDDTVLQNVSFTAERGEFVAFVGPSGAGKSTVVSLLARMYEPDSGRIMANGLPIHKFDVADWREQVAVIRQNPFIFNDTLRYNITIGNRDASERQIRKACEVAQITEFLDDLPQGLDTVLGDDGVRLSGGQQQRVSIARALLKDADVLVLDEATSDLDTTLEEQVHTGIEEMATDHVMIVIAHRLSTVRNADCIYTMKDGQITESGQHLDLIENDGKYAELYATQ